MEQRKTGAQRLNDRITQRNELKRLGLDTFSSDLNAANDSLNTYLTGGWQDSAAADTQRQSINALLSRIQNTKAFMQKYADSYDKATLDSYLADLDSVEKSLTEAGSYIDTAASNYANFENADAYNEALRAVEYDTELRALGEKYADLDSAALSKLALDIRADAAVMPKISDKQGGLVVKGSAENMFYDKYGFSIGEAAAYADKLDILAAQRYLDSFADASADEIRSMANELREAYKAYSSGNSYKDLSYGFGTPDAADYKNAVLATAGGGPVNAIREKYGIVPAALEQRANELDRLATARELKDTEAWASQQADFKQLSEIDPNADSIPKIAAFINKTEMSQNYRFYGGHNAHGLTEVEELQLFYDHAEDGERKTYNYLLNTKGKDAAEAYAENLLPILEQRNAKKVNEEAVRFASEHPWLASGVSVGQNVIFGPRAAIETMMEYLFTGKINEDSATNIQAGMTEVIRETVPKAWASKYKLDEGWAGTVSFLYGTGMSIADNVALNAATGGALSEQVVRVAMGLNAAGSAMRSAKANGATDDQAFALGTVVGVLEYFWEALPISHFFKALNGTGKSALKIWLSQALIEASEELGTEVCTIIADTLIMADKSEIAKRAQELEAQGLSTGAIIGTVFAETLGQAGLAALGGAISGGVMGGAAAVIRGGSDSSAGAGIIRLGAAQSVVDAGLKMGEGTDAYEIASQLQKRSNTRMKNAQKKAANSQTVGNSAADGAAVQGVQDGAAKGDYRATYDSEAIGRLYRLISKQAGEQYIQKYTHVYEQKLSEMGTKSPQKLAERLARFMAGESLNKVELRSLAKSEAAQRLIAESQELLDLSTEWNVLQKQTKYKTDHGVLVVQRRGDSNRYDVSFFENIHDQVAEDAERADKEAGGASPSPTNDNASEAVTPPMRELNNRTIPQVEAIIDGMREGKSFGDVMFYEKEGASVDGSFGITYDSAIAAGVPKHNATLLASLSAAFGGDLRIYFGDTGDGRRGLFRTEYDGTRSVVINPRSVADVNDVITHEIFHDLEKTEAGRAFIELAIEYAKEQPPKANAKFSDAANRYEQIKKLYESDGRTKKQDIPGEVAAKVAAEVLGGEKALQAVLDRMNAREASEFTKKLKRAAKAIKNRLSKVDKTEVKGAKLAEHRADMMLELYTKAAKQRALQNTLDNAVGGAPRTSPPTEPQKGTNGSNTGENTENSGVTTTNAENMHVSEESSQKDAEKSSDRSNLAKVQDESRENAERAVFGENGDGEDTSRDYSVRACLTEAPEIGAASIKFNEKSKNVEAAALKVGVEAMMEMAQTMLPYLEEDGILPADKKGKTIFKNGSYGRSGENTTICVRTLTYEDFKDRVSEELGRPLTVAESLLVSQKIYDIATDPQCIYCYVAADRKAYDEYLGKYQQQMDKYIKALAAGGDSKALFDEYLDGRDPTNAQKKRWASWEKIAKNGDKYISASDLATRAKRELIIQKGGALAEQVRDAQRYAQSASWAKKVEDYRAYNGEILRLSKQLVDQLNSEYGLRMYSFSDYTPAFIVENMQMIIDAACRGLKSLAYTKDTDYVKIFAKTGQAINVSCFAKWDPINRTYVEDSRQGAGWAETKKLRAEHENVGSVMVATTPKMVEWALAQDWIDIVIPYHIVKTGTTIANEYDWRNFTADSADKLGSKVKNIYPNEHDNDFAKYKALVEERGLTPRFSEYYDKAISGEITGEQYMKLVNEVRLPASRLSAVVPDFDLDAARESFGVTAEGKVIKGGFVDKGGYMGSWYREGVDITEAAAEVASDIRAGKKSTEVEYGMSAKAKQRQAEKYGVEKADLDEEDMPTNSREYARMKAEEERAAAPRRVPTATYKPYSVSYMQDMLSDAVKLITSEALSENAREGDPYFVNIKTRGKAIADVAAQLSESFNLAQEKGANEEELRAISNAAAEYLIANTYADDADFIAKLTEEQDRASRALSVLSHGIRRMNLGNIEVGDIQHHYGKKAARSVLSRWRATKNAKVTVMPSEIANELAELGVPLSIENDSWAEADILIALNELYLSSKETFEQTVRSQIGTAEEYTALRDRIAAQVMEAYREGEADVRVAKATAAAKVIVDVVKAKELSRRKRDTGALASDEWKALVKSISSIATTYNISIPAVRDFALKYRGFVALHAGELNSLLTAEDGDDGNEERFRKYVEAKTADENQVLSAIDPKTARGVYAIAEGDASTPLTLDELEALHAGIRNLLALDNRYNRVFKDGRWQNTDTYAKTAINESRAYWGDDKAKNQTGASELARALFDATIDPEYVAARVGGYDRHGILASAVHEIKLASIEAQYKEKQYMAAIENFFAEHKEFAKRYRDERIDFKYVRENPLTHEKADGSVTITLGELFGLYMTAKRKHAFISLAMSNIKFDAIPGVRKHEQTLKGLHPDLSGLTEVQIEAITRGMGNGLIAQINKVFDEVATEEDRQFVAIVEKFFAETSKNEKKGMDLILFGYTNVVDGYYYPIARDKSAFDVNLIGNDRIIDSIVGVNSFSFNKATIERANKTMRIRDAFTVTQNHAHQLAVYTTMTVPLQNLNRIYNCKVGGENGSLNHYIDEHVSKQFGKYLRDYLIDVQGVKRETNSIDAILNKPVAALKSNYAKSVLALNAKSIATQFSTVFAMSGQVSYASWAKGIALGASIARTEGENGEILKRLAELDEYSHAAAVRNDANEQYLATGVAGKLNAATDKLMIGQVVTDRITCLCMFYMCQYEVQKKQGLAVGTKENKIAAGKMLDDMILELQDTSGAATKTGIARNKNEIVSSLATFRSSELKQWSRLVYMAGEIKAHGIKGRKAAYAKEVASFMSQKLYTVALALIWAAIRAKWPKDEEGKDKNILEVGFTELLTDIVGFVPVIGSFAESAITGFSQETLTESAINDAIDAVVKLRSLVEDIFDGEPDELGELWNKFISALCGLGSVFGIPVRNVKNIADIVINGVNNFVPSSEQYKVQDALYSKNYTKDLKEAVESGDMALASTIIDMMMYDRAGSYAGGEAAEELADLYASGEDGLFPSEIGEKITVKINDESVELELSAEEQAAFRKEYNKSAGAVKSLIGSKSYSRLTSAERATAIRDMYSLYMNRTKSKLHGADMTTAVAMTNLISEQKYITAMAHIKAIKADKKIANKKTAIERYLRSLGLTRAEQQLILYGAGYRGAENKNAVSRAIRGAKLSAKEKKAVKAALGIE